MARKILVAEGIGRAVSYTHLDVYKRQICENPKHKQRQG